MLLLESMARSSRLCAVWYLPLKRGCPEGKHNNMTYSNHVLQAQLKSECQYVLGSTWFLRLAQCIPWVSSRESLEETQDQHADSSKQYHPNSVQALKMP